MTSQRAALYLRVSTDDQTIENQRRELAEWADRSGLAVVHTYEDEGLSGSKGRDKRPGLDAMLKDATRKKFDVVGVWSVDRLGRSTLDLLTTLKELHGSGVDLFIHKQAVDTRTQAGRMMYGMLGLFAEFEREMIVERTKVGLGRARAQGRVGGRRKIVGEVANRYCWLRDWGVGINRAARVAMLGNSAAARIEEERRQAPGYEPRPLPGGITAEQVPTLDREALWALVTKGVKGEDWHKRRTKLGEPDIGAAVLAEHQAHSLLPKDEQKKLGAAAVRRQQARRRRARKARS